MVCCGQNTTKMDSPTTHFCTPLFGVNGFQGMERATPLHSIPLLPWECLLKDLSYSFKLPRKCKFGHKLHSIGIEALYYCITEDGVHSLRTHRHIHQRGRKILERQFYSKSLSIPSYAVWPYEVGAGSSFRNNLNMRHTLTCY